MTMRYFENPVDSSINGYDDTIPAQADQIAAAIAAGWPEVTSTWPPFQTLRDAKNTGLLQSFTNAVNQPVSYTTQASVTETFAADPGTASDIRALFAGFNQAQATPSGFYWPAVDGTQVPFTYADILGLMAVISAQWWTWFQHLETLRAQVAAATTPAQLSAIVW